MTDRTLEELFSILTNRKAESDKKAEEARAEAAREAERRQREADHFDALARAFEATMRRAVMDFNLQYKPTEVSVEFGGGRRDERFLTFAPKTRHIDSHPLAVLHIGSDEIVTVQFRKNDERVGEDRSFKLAAFTFDDAKSLLTHLLNLAVEADGR